MSTVELIQDALLPKNTNQGGALTSDDELNGIFVNGGKPINMRPQWIVVKPLAGTVPSAGGEGTGEGGG